MLGSLLPVPQLKLTPLSAHPAGLTPLMKMHTLGAQFVPDPIHAGGLRYHGMSPLVSHVYNLGEWHSALHFFQAMEWCSEYTEHIVMASSSLLKCCQMCLPIIIEDKVYS